MTNKCGCTESKLGRAYYAGILGWEVFKETFNVVTKAVVYPKLKCLSVLYKRNGNSSVGTRRCPLW